MNILITAASRRVALVKYFKQALQTKNIKGKIVTTDIDPFSAALYFSDSCYTVPLSTSTEYIPEILNICEKEKISLVIPTIDEEISIFAQNSTKFTSKKIKLLVSDSKVGNICNDKYYTCKFFLQKNIPTPATFLPSELSYENLEYPLFIKPRIGRGSVDSFPAYDRKSLDFFIDYVENPIIQEFLPGAEFTIDVLSDFNGNVISVVPRERLVVRAGVSDRGITVKDKRLIDYGKKIAELLNIIGPSNIQCKVNGDEIKFFEINPRFSGGIQLTINSGANFAKMIVAMAQEKPVPPCIGDFTDGMTMISYEKSIFLDPGQK